MSIDSLRPTFHADTIERLTPDALREIYLHAPMQPKIEAMAFDVDGTLMQHHGEVFDDTVKDTLFHLANAGIKLFIISNAYGARVDQLNGIVDASGIPFKDVYTPASVAGGENPKKFRKPNPAMLQRIIELDQIAPENMLMVGDQLFKDIWSANKAGTQSLLVPRRGESDDWKVRAFQRPVEAAARKAMGLRSASDFPKFMLFADAPQAPDDGHYFEKVPRKGNTWHDRDIVDAETKIVAEDV